MFEESVISIESSAESYVGMGLDSYSDSENATSDASMGADSDSDCEELSDCTKSHRLTKPWHLHENDVTELKCTREAVIKELSRRVLFIFKQYAKVMKRLIRISKLIIFSNQYG